MLLRQERRVLPCTSPALRNAPSSYWAKWVGGVSKLDGDRGAQRGRGPLFLKGRFSARPTLWRNLDGAERSSLSKKKRTTYYDWVLRSLAEVSQVEEKPDVNGAASTRQERAEYLPQKGDDLHETFDRPRVPRSSKVGKMLVASEKGYYLSGLEKREILSIKGIRRRLRGYVERRRRIT